MSSLRRSSTKLMSLGSSHRELMIAISSQKELRSAVNKMMSAQEDSTMDILKWSSKEENRAIKDVLERFTEICQLWTEAVKEFSDDLKEIRHHFEMILEGEKVVDNAKAQVEAAESKEIKLQKDAKKLKKRSTFESNELQDIEDKIAKVQRDKDYLETEASSKVKDQELVKMVRVKTAMKKLCSSHLSLSDKEKILFTAGNELIDYIPDLPIEALDHEILNLRYQGTAKTTAIVLQAKNALQNPNSVNSDQNDGAAVGSTLPSSPPPYEEIQRQLPTNPYYPSSPEASFNTSSGSPCLYPPLNVNVNGSDHRRSFPS